MKRIKGMRGNGWVNVFTDDDYWSPNNCTGFNDGQARSEFLEPDEYGDDDEQEPDDRRSPE